MARSHLQHSVCLFSSASLLTHLLGVATLGSSLHSVLSWDTYIAKAYGSYFQFLTVIGLTLSLSVFILAAIADIFRSTTLYRWKNFISIVATPLEVLISSLYWGICAIDASLLVAPGLEISMLMDLGLHLAPAVFLFLDFIMFSPPWTISAYGMMLVNTVSAFAYWYWVELCYSKNGWYPYPIFKLLTTGQRALLFTFSAGLMTTFHGLLKWTYKFVDGNRRRRQVHVKVL